MLNYFFINIYFFMFASMFNKIKSIILIFCAYTAASQQITFEKYYDYGYAEAANSVQQTFDGGYILAGRQGIGIGVMDLMLIKTDSTGEVEWDYFYGTGMNANKAHDVVQTYDSGFAAVGHTTVLGMKSNIFLLRTDKNGNLLWTKDYGTTESEEGSSIAQTYDSGFIVTGRWNNDTAFLLKTDKYGDTAWFKTYIDSGYTSSLGFSVAQTEDSGFVFTGTINPGDILSDVYVVRTDKHGNTLWTTIVGGADNDEGQSIALTNDGGYIVTGYTWSFAVGMYDVYLIKLDSNGNVEWTKTFGDHGNDGSYKVLTVDDGFIVGGFMSEYNNSWDNKPWIIKIDILGEIIWEKSYKISHVFNDLVKSDDGGFAFCGMFEGDAYLSKTDSQGGIINSINHLNIPEHEVKVYPNPLSIQSIVEITGITEFSNTTLHLYNATGQEVLAKTVTSPQTTIYRNNLPAGIYILQVRQETRNIQTIKILIQ